MNNKAFTLIELMIVVAVLGIMSAAFSAPVSFFLKRSLLNADYLDEKRTQTTVFYCMKHFLGHTAIVERVMPNEVKFSNNHRIQIINAKHKILFFDGKETRTVHLGKSMRFSKLKKIDYLTFGCYMALNRAIIPMFWRSENESN